MLDNYLKWCSFFFAFAGSYYCIAMENKAGDPEVTSISEFEQRNTERSPEEEEVTSHPRLMVKEELLCYIAAQTSEQCTSFQGASWGRNYQERQGIWPINTWIDKDPYVVETIKGIVRFNAPGDSNVVCVSGLVGCLCDVNVIKIILENSCGLFPSSVDITQRTARLTFSSPEEALLLVDEGFEYRGMYYNLSFASQYKNREILLIGGLPDAHLNSFGVVASALTNDRQGCLVEAVYFERFGPYLAAVIGIKKGSKATREERLAAIKEVKERVIEIDEEQYKVFSLGSFF